MRNRIPLTKFLRTEAVVEFRFAEQSAALRRSAK